MKLSEVQSAFQMAVLTGDAEDARLLDLVAAPRATDRVTMLGVYVNAYRLRLAEFLDEDYPALRVLLGDDDFEALVEAYIDASPSRLRNARWYSTRLPEFMRDSENWSANRLAIGVALFERALTDAYDAADAPSQGIETLAEFSPQDWPRLGFKFHPSLRLVEVAAGTLDAYVAANADDEETQFAEEDEAASERRFAATPDGDSPETASSPSTEVEIVAVWRSELDPAYRQLDADEYLALNEAAAGHSFGDICQLVAFQNGNQPATERLAQFLVTWFSEGLVTEVAEAK
ncbi:MAG: DNA-binding domain-containing protein [Methylocystis sp.]